MAPEVLEHQPYDERADVYSFAITVWELITARVPYCDMAPMQVRSKKVWDYDMDTWCLCTMQVGVRRVWGDGVCGEGPARTRLL